MLALIAAIVITPLLYIPGYVIRDKLLGAPATDVLEQHYERIVFGTLLNGWLAFTLAELGVFMIWLHLLILLIGCVAVFGCVYGIHRLPFNNGTRNKHADERTPRRLLRFGNIRLSGDV